MRGEEILRFRRLLLLWYEAHQRKLPWRQTRDPYLIWISEVMLQQTQTQKVLAYYPEFVRRFPTIRRLATADLDSVLKAWEGLGYYGRARNLHEAARIILHEMSGNIPREYDRLRKLPGVGPYTAAAVQSLAFGHPCPVVDGNVKRVLSRLFLLEEPTHTPGAEGFFREKSAELLDPNLPGEFNQAMMELGATICRRRRPLCPDCPVRVWCRSNHANRQEDIPIPTRSRPIPEYHVAAAVIYKDRSLLITRRRLGGLLGGLWEFPGGKVQKGETAEEACVREIREELNVSIVVVDFLTQIKHAYTHFKIVMDVFHCLYQSGEILLNGPVDYRWIAIEEIDRFPFPAANHKFIPLLRERIAKG